MEILEDMDVVHKIVVFMVYSLFSNKNKQTTKNKIKIK